MRISRCQLIKQSRLAGFFLCWIFFSACSEAPAIKTNLHLQQAIAAEQQNLLSKALPLYQKAALAGETEAVAAVLRLSPQDMTIAKLAQWLQSLPLSDKDRQPFLVQLGLWQQLPSAEAERYQQQWQLLFANSMQNNILENQQQASTRAKHCALTLQPVLSTAQSATQWQQLLQQWRQDQQLSTLSICFSAPLFVDALELACSQQQGERIDCNEQVLKQVVLKTHATHVLVLAGHGGASYNNGWLQLPDTATLPLLRHELSHVFGFIDEYPLAATIAESECLVGRITPNLLFSLDDLPAYLDLWQIAASDVELTAVDSCLHTNRQAYRVVRQDSHLQHYELSMPDLYLQLMHKQLQRPEQLMPVAYYFAYLARQEQDWQAWQQWMQLAAAAGYPPAQEVLAEMQTKQTSSVSR